MRRALAHRFRAAQAKDTRLRTVQLEGQVILKLVKHCQECEPALVTGQLLGLDIGQTLEVTDCFPFPVRFAAVHWSQVPHSESCEGHPCFHVHKML